VPPARGAPGWSVAFGGRGCAGSRQRVSDSGFSSPSRGQRLSFHKDLDACAQGEQQLALVFVERSILKSIDQRQQLPTPGSLNLQLLSYLHPPFDLVHRPVVVGGHRGAVADG